MESSRAKILAAVKQNQGASKALPILKTFPQDVEPIQKFQDVLKSIGGQVYSVKSLTEMEDYVQRRLPVPKRIISLVDGISGTEEIQKYNIPAALQDVDLFITKAVFGVAENGAVWLREDDLHERALPFIAQHVVVVLEQENIVSTMHDAYAKIGNVDYGFAAFIAGPSKTADIEQSLVLGAHGAMTMTVFIKS
jgi:L-lactate dehydrogenase complex protein LldG